ncbi:hypothetical protein ACJMK2_002532 [Sinanodonta woodiana]|uniref:Uncharacterized protein n=1 Tax=Sinanodonta woodiana TaxID=1069815 RepID=A0ABD3XVL3_SINWO
MRNMSIFLLLLVLCEVVLSSGVNERRSYSDENDEKAALERLLQEIDEGKVDVNDLMADKENNPSRRLWLSARIRIRLKHRK